ncbi:MAG TPA: hypothetical protein VJN71_06055 [Nitrososphaerales archaeon]|nr:hypothetical protein [Nitrososphaerales archaeon]
MSNNNQENNTGNPAPSVSQPTDNEKPRRRFRSLLWVVIVLLIGAIVGIISFLLIAPHLSFGGAGPFPFFGGPVDLEELSTSIAEHIILSTVSIALLISLVSAYAKIFRQTRANFALGIFIVLIALLLDAILTYPILQLFYGGIPTADLNNPLPPLGDLLTIVAYTVFLYLSLQ